ncbi:HD-GYP domain-containing protein [Streptomyces polyrhachis]|uniref:HD-GYP domain-containing protein n=1 Tax=Streptomyces polyrhachis TaxID=1282885 RepID=A0ABW2GGB9_9ACTN
MRMPAGGWALVLAATAAAALCAAPAAVPVLPGAPARTDWGALVLLAGLYALCALLWRLMRGDPGGPSGFYPVLLAGAFLLHPAEAALVAVPGALLSPVRGSPAAPRRIWRAAQLALACAAAAGVCRLAGPERLAAPVFPRLLLQGLAVALAFCLVLLVLEAAVLVTAERRPPVAVVRQLTGDLPAYVVHGPAGLMMAVLWRSSYGPFSSLLVLLPMYVSCWVFAQYHRERAAHQATIRALVQAVDIKDRYTRGHSERVGRASVLIGRELGLAEERREVLRFAGILHDVGKLGVPTRILRKDGPLTDEERRVIQLHPEYGHEMVRGIGFLEDARSAILHHHERLDGRGYPYGLAGEDIPEFARVVAVADAFDAMTSTRSYRRARAVPAALAELEACAGRQFDPRMVGALVRAIGRHGWHAEVTSDEAAAPLPDLPDPPDPPAAAPARTEAELPAPRRTGSASPAADTGRPDAPTDTPSTAPSGGPG